MKTDVDAFDIARDELGVFGRMLSGSKSGYERTNPDSKPVFNANIIGETHGKIWYGDLDLKTDKDRSALQRLANRLGTKVFVLREMDARFKNEDNPLIENAVETFVPNASEKRATKPR